MIEVGTTIYILQIAGVALSMEFLSYIEREPRKEKFTLCFAHAEREQNKGLFNLATPTLSMT